MATLLHPEAFGSSPYTRPLNFLSDPGSEYHSTKFASRYLYQFPLGYVRRLPTGHLTPNVPEPSILIRQVLFWKSAAQQKLTLLSFEVLFY